MPSNYTEHYQLNLWDAGDQVQRVDFNADNAKVDAAIHAVAQKADSLSSTKAEQSALTAEVNTRISQVSTINAALAKKGNCQIYFTTYTGNGELTRTITFPQKPRAVFIMGTYTTLRWLDGQNSAPSTYYSGTGTCVSVRWSGTRMTWDISSTSKDSCCNNKDELYSVVALIDAAG